MTARILGVLLGLWLVVSVFLWPHTSAQGANAVLCGIACMALTTVGLYFEPARYICAGLGAWIFLSTFLLASSSRATVWNNAVVGIAVFVTALVAGGPDEIRRREAYGRM